MKQLKSLPLYETNDYSIFKFIKENRETNRIQVNKLVRVINERGNISKIAPILVNEKLEIIDGQHRLKAFEQVANEQGIKHNINFIVRDDLNARDAMQLNAGAKPWTPDDYARFHAKMGNRNYMIFLNFRDRFELNADVLFKYLAPLDGNRSDFQNGHFIVANENESRKWCSRLEQMKQYYSDYKHRSFALAFLELVSHKNYDHSRMLDQLDQYASDLIRIPLKNKPMKEALIEIFNKRIPNKFMFD